MGLTIVGCGYVGLALARQLQPRRSHLPLTLTTTREERRHELAALSDGVMVCDATNPTQLLRALNKSRRAVFCLGPKGDRQVNEDGYRQTFIASFTCLQSLLPQLPDLQQILYTSSCSIYGNADGGWVDEAAPPDPRNGHAQVLVESEQLIGAMADGRRNVCILRLGALYGPGRDLDTRLKGLAGREQSSDGQQFTNWIHVEDAAGALIAAMDGEWNGVVNVVNDAPICLKDLVDHSLRRQGLDPVQWGRSANQRLCSRRINNERLKALGYQLQHPTLHSQSGVFPFSQAP